jgi:HAD superfamily hydrolase (TIGR01490 family)
VSETSVRERTLQFYLGEVRSQMRPGARRALEEHRGEGHRLVLLTSSSQYLSEAVSEELRLDGFLCNSFEVEGGFFTGRAVRPLCFGRGKVDHATRFAKEHGVPLEQCAFYTDSFSDLPMLEAVGEPVVVHPDPRLRRAAKKRGWRIVDWDA